MYINPNSTIKILQNVPLDNTYEHTIYFADSSAQSSYFSGLAKYTFEAQSYQRVKRGYIRVATNAENLYDCNYLMFQNSAFGSKWFYAFIKSVEYINNGVSEIEFEIDVMQTWHFNYNLQECVVEREHTATDKVGDNIVPEKINLGEYKYYNIQSSGVKDKLCYVVDTTVNRNYEDVLYSQYTMLDKTIVTGMGQELFPLDNIGADALVQWLYCGGDSGKRVKLNNGIKDIRIGCNTQRSFLTYDRPNTVDGYTPKNKKLLTYPYTFCYATNYQGGSAVYPFEYFSSNPNIQFLVSTESTSFPMASLIPYNYKGIAVNSEERICINKAPAVAWSCDFYDIWLANEMTNIPTYATNTLSNVITTGTSSMNYDSEVIDTSGINNQLNMFGNYLSNALKADLQPPQSKGNTCGIMDIWNDSFDIAIMTKSITAPMAMCIDDYFTKFGYAINRIKVPNRNVRPHWTFTKTIGCTITGSVPCDDMKKICSIYDRGITFWNNGNNIGNYSLSNSPITS